MHLDLDHVDKHIKEAEEILKKFPDAIGLKLNLESMKAFRAEAANELERREKCEKEA